MSGYEQEMSLQLPGFDIGPVLYRYAGRVVYRAHRLADHAVVAIETLDVQYPERQQVASVHREWNLTQRLAAVEGIRRLLQILPHGSGNVALVGELFEGTLQTRLQLADKGLPLDEALDIALRIARALGGMHAQDLVCKSLTPEHVLFDPERGVVALAGFGIASELDQERQALHSSRCFEGDLPYLSPEQTGRMNRDLDYRSDFYSLGVVLFQMLTGQLPFSADNPLEWVHCHISRLPPDPHQINAEVPPVVAAIVLKLLSKSPESRYQSAAGLIHDLERCVQNLSAGLPPNSFALGQQDAVQKFLVPQHLFGREREVAELLGLFESAVGGATEFCLVHGESGVGKSALVNEIDRPLVRERGFLVQGKFDQFQQGEAYTALGATFRGLVQQILGEPEAVLDSWRQRLEEALSPNAQLVIQLVPELSLVLGPQPDVTPLPPAEERNRLHIVFMAFLRVFAGQGHPVVLFLDDLQWSDIPTLELLRRLVTSRELTHLLLIGAFRSNEVGVGHPLRNLIEELKPHHSLRQLPVGPLESEAVAQLVATALNREDEDVETLSDMLFSKTRGNPFFINELLRQLHKEGAITPNLDSGGWNWEPERAQWSGISDDVVQFMISSLRGLPAETQQVLQLASCIGSSFDLHTLAAIYQHSEVATALALLPALKQHAVLPQHSDYRLVGCDRDGVPFNPSYRFQHDRVQQAAYELIDADRLAEVRLSVGRLMLKHVAKSDEHRLIDVVGHLNAGRSLIHDAQERLMLVRLNVQAGERVRHAAAYESALQFLRTALELLPEAPWERAPELMRSVAEELQQCAYLTNRIDEAEHWMSVLLTHATTDLARSNLQAIRTRQYATLGRMEDSIRAAIEGLKILGVAFTDQPSLEDIARERQRVLENLGTRRIEQLVDAPWVDDEAVLTAMRLLMEIFAAAFLSGSGNLFPYQVLKAVNLSLRHGNCPESAFAYAAYGMLLCGELDEPALGYQYGRVGMAINEHIDDLPLRARVIYVYAMFVHHWSNHWSTLTPWFRKGIEAGYQSGDLLYLAYSAQDCVIWDPLLDLETAEQLHAEYLEIVRECAYQDSLDSGTLFLQMQRNMLGRTHSPGTLSDDGFDAERCLEGMKQRQFMTGIANYHIYHAEISVLYGDFDTALVHVRQQDALIKSAMSLPQLVRFYILACITLTTHFPRMNTAQKQQTRERLQRDLERMTRWANNCSANFRHLQYLMEAELARIDGHDTRVLSHYDAAIDAARSSGFLRDEACACERAALYLLAQGQHRSAEGYLRGAYRLYDRWGALRKVEQMADRYPVLVELIVSPPSGGRNEMPDLDVASIMKASREISGEIVLERLLETSLQILLENAGGEWGCLVVRNDTRFSVVATQDAERAPVVNDLPDHLLVMDANGTRRPLPVTLINQVMHRGEAIVLHDAAREGDFVHDPYVQRCQPRSVLCVPIVRERFEAALYMENNLASDIFTQSRVEVIRLLAAQAAVALENARLYEQLQDHSRLLEEKVAERTARLEQLNRELQRLADRDGLTGVANRRRGDAYLNEVWVRLRREGQPLAVIMLDVDHFKAYNDNYGHQAGDDCLILVAEALRDQLRRPSDLVARYGGEEFMLILPNTDASGALQLGEKIRAAVEALAIEHGHSDTAPVVTVSAGAANVVPVRDNGWEELLREADRALYRSKGLGRNRVHSVTLNGVVMEPIAG